MNIFDVLYARNTGKIRPRAKITDNLLGLALAGGGTEEKTIDFTPVISISDAVGGNALDYQFKITATQSGSGDPSPTNIRPISGFTGAEITRAGKNLIDISTLATDRITYSDGVLTGTAGIFSVEYGTGIPFDYSKFMGSQLAFSIEAKSNGPVTADTNGLIIRFVYTDGTRDATIWKNSDTEYTRKSMVSNKNKIVDYIMITYSNAGSNEWSVRNMQIEIGDSVTDYAPYNGTLYPVSWQSEAGTVYGGVLNVTTGTLTATYTITDLGQYDYTKLSLSGGRNVFYFPMSILANEAKLPSSSSVPNAICSVFKGIAQTASSWGINTFVFTVFAGTIPGRCVGFIVNASDYADETDFKTDMSGQKLVYELAEPITYTLTPTDITLAEGANTIWSDTGDSKMTYLAKK